MVAVVYYNVNVTSYLGLYVLINVCCAATVLICAFHSRAGLGEMLLQRRFETSVFMLVIFFASDTLWYAMDTGALPQVWAWSMALKTVYFLSASFAGYLWFLYMGTLTEASYLKNRTTVILLLAPVVLHALLCLFNLNTGILFSIGDDFEYHRGPLFSIQYIVIYLYLLAAGAHAVYKAFLPDNYVERTRYIIIALFPVLPAISGILQLFYWRIPFNCVAFALGITIVYLNELGQQISTEPLTQLANRRQFMRSLEQNLRDVDPPSRVYLYMLDLDRLKSVNDTWGHAEGDDAIAHTAEILKRAVSTLHRKATLARYGGDEFAIVSVFEDPADAKRFKQTIRDEFDRENEQSDQGYRLSMSVGMQGSGPECNTVRSMLEAADADLYREKALVHGTDDFYHG